MRPLRVGLIAPPWLAVPPQLYGGTEFVVDQLARGLTSVGCEVVLFTTGDATCPVDRRWLFPTALGTAAAHVSMERRHAECAYRELTDVDIIHDHTQAGPLLSEARWPDVPVVTTLHNEITGELRGRYAAVAAQIGVVAISHAQRSTAPEVPVTAVIHHGVDVARFPLGNGDGGYVLFLGRMSPGKGAHRAVAAARAAGKPIVLAAKMREPAERRYFAERVEPMLGPDASYVGEVGGQEKLDLLARAEALVNPIRWPEPFGLVMIESLACGTPVLAFPEGAAPEIVEHGRTGFLCTDEMDMARKLARVGTLDRAVCRASAKERFSTERMVAEYLGLYRRLLATARARSVLDYGRVA